MWVNTLRSRCVGLQPDDTLIVRKHGGTRICEYDKFQVADYFARGPLDPATGIDCVFGEFRPITEQQLEEIEAVLSR